MSIPQSGGGPIEHPSQLAEYLAAGCKPKSDWRIGTEHEKFGITLPEPGHYHEWQTVDGSNTLSMRIDRHARMREKVRDLGLNAVVQATDEFDPGRR
mgnify:CR=1 FL=1